MRVSISRKAKRSYYEKFWATVMPLFSNKIKSTEYISLMKNGKIISNDREKARIFEEFLVNIVPNFGVNTNHDFLINVEYSV